MENHEDNFEDLEELQSRLLGGAKSLSKPNREITLPAALDKDADLGLSRKDKLTQDIERLRKAQGLGVQSNNHYRKSTIAMLEGELAKLAERGVNQLQGMPSQQPKAVSWKSENQEVEYEPEELGDDTADSEGDTDDEFDDLGAPMDWNADMLGKTLFQLNQIIAKSAETISVSFKDDIGTSLEGFTDDLNSKEEQLTQVLLEIYYEHHETLAPIMTPMAKYGIIMATSASSVAISNAKKQAKNE